MSSYWPPHDPHAPVYQSPSQPSAAASPFGQPAYLAYPAYAPMAPHQAGLPGLPPLLPPGYAAPQPGAAGLAPPAYPAEAFYAGGPGAAPLAPPPYPLAHGAVPGLGYAGPPGVAAYGPAMVQVPTPQAVRRAFLDKTLYNAAIQEAPWDSFWGRAEDFGLTYKSPHWKKMVAELESGNWPIGLVIKARLNWEHGIKPAESFHENQNINMADLAVAIGRHLQFESVGGQSLRPNDRGLNLATRARHQVWPDQIYFVMSRWGTVYAYQEPRQMARTGDAVAQLQAYVHDVVESGGKQYRPETKQVEHMGQIISSETVAAEANWSDANNTAGRFWFRLKPTDSELAAVQVADQRWAAQGVAPYRVPPADQHRPYFI